MQEVVTAKQLAIRQLFAGKWKAETTFHNNIVRVADLGFVHLLNRYIKGFIVNNDAHFVWHSELL
jgi:hypothetical protein